MKSYKCICQLCSCGKHSCPKPSRPKNELFPRPVGTVVGDTEYKTIFLKHDNVTPRENFKPPQAAIKRDSPMSKNTTNRVDYIPHPVTPYVPRSGAIYKRPEGTISRESEYIREYHYKVPEPVKPIVPVSTQMRTTADNKFSGKTTQSSDFVPYETQPRIVYGENRAYKPPTEKFEGSSTFQSDFKGTQATEPTLSMKPVQEAKVSQEPFDNTSCYNTEFKKFQVPEKLHRPKQVYKPPEGKFYGISSFTSDFPGYRGVSPAQSYKPPMTAKASQEPLESLTTNRVSYQKWDIPPLFSRPPTTYEPPKEKFQGKTVFTDDFIAHSAMEPVQSFKPKQEPVRINAAFEHQTINRINFRPIDLSQRQPLVVKENKYVIPTEKFEGRSTTSDAYQGQFNLPAESCKPQLKPYSKGVKFDETSTYKRSYVHPGVKPDCMTGGDPTFPTIPGFTFSYEDPRSGHKFYTPVATPAKPPTPPPPPTIVPQTQAITAC